MKTKIFFALAAALLTTRAHAQDAASPAAAETAAPTTAMSTQDVSATGAAQSLQDQPAAAKTSPAPAEEAEAGTLSQAELDALLQQPAEVEAVDTSLRISGFADFAAAQPIKARGLAAGDLHAGIGKYQSFYVGNLNLYVSKNLSESFRSMMEVRLTYMPNGYVQVKDFATLSLDRMSTQIGDYADSGHSDRWGGIILQRVYLEWNVHPNLTIRGGQFLTPYGIWNVDHGSPAYIPVQRPYAVGNDWFPERQTGFELFGRTDLGSNSAVGYHLTVSNGTGPVSEYRDLDKNKAIGTRLFVEHRAASGYLRIGASGYYGRDTGSVPSIAINSDGTFTLGSKVLSQYDSLGLAADILYKRKRWHLQGEWVSRQLKYTRAGRPQITTPAGSGDAADSFNWAAYALVGYRTPWWALMPYVMGQYTKETNDIAHANVELAVLHVGINLHPIDAVTFKLEYYTNWMIESFPGIDAKLGLLQFQAAWAF